MIPLPICRWRRGYNEHQYVCRSAKFINPPNLVIAADCAKCAHVDHEEEPAVRALPCVHLGNPTEGEESFADADGTLIDVFDCVLHGHCTIDESLPGRPEITHTCATCPDFLTRE